ncbi:TaqI-like C-terminal specificity domain-containing protein [Dysgonomonas termitidis]|uniref:site-specific DNA-methyltransferase (adenine-specific) n=1 Tax=Dysgonomonas termitidis TaxID=1516126 RepID=A0ABV9KRT2_9BACT
MQQAQVICEFTNSNSWVVLSSIEQSIKQKIEAIGTPLKDWDIQINYGIKTGLNEAFIIPTEKRDEILAACLSEEERKKTDALIRPILRGRDIKRYGYEWADRWLISTHNGIKEKNIPRVDIENYPAIKAHLDSFWGRIEHRSDQGDTPYNLRNCVYMEDFLKPKILYPDISQRLSFCYCSEHIYCNNTVYFITTKNNDDLPILIEYLNSNLINWYYRTLSVQLGETAVRMFSIYVLNISIPKNVSSKTIYEAFDLNKEEINFIESYN